MKQLGLVLAMVLGVGCVAPAGGAYGAYGQASYAAAPAAAPAYGTGIFVNGTELAAEEKAQLEMIVDQVVPPGRYWMDASYNFGLEGERGSVNLRERLAAKQQQSGGRGMSMYSTDSAGRGSSIVSEGGCTILSTPDGSLSSGC